MKPWEITARKLKPKEASKLANGLKSVREVIEGLSSNEMRNYIIHKTNMSDKEYDEALEVSKTLELGLTRILDAYELVKQEKGPH